MRKFVLDANCFIAASRSDENAALLEIFVERAAPRLYLSTVVAAELRAGMTRIRDLRKFEEAVLKPYYKRGRVINPSAAAWESNRLKYPYANPAGRPVAFIPRASAGSLRLRRPGNTVSCGRNGRGGLHWNRNRHHVCAGTISG